MKTWKWKAVYIEARVIWNCRERGKRSSAYVAHTQATQAISLSVLSNVIFPLTEQSKKQWQY